MPPKFALENYVDVQERINRFWAEYPHGSIVTRLMSPPDDFQQCRYEAVVYQDRDDQRAASVGYAFETAGTGGANQTSHEENCETSAIGRALANMGYAKNREDRPSRQEMEKAGRPPAQHPNASPRPPQRVTEASGGKITEKQIDFALKMQEACHISDADFTSGLRSNYQVDDLGALTSRQASDLLDRLKAKRDGIVAQRQDPGELDGMPYDVSRYVNA